MTALPRGLGVFVRNQWQPGPWRWAAVNAHASSAPQLVRRARAAGCRQVWLYMLVGMFTPSRWREGLALLEQKATSIRGVTTIMVDVENGWTDEDGDEATAFGAELRAVHERTGLGIAFTAFPFIVHVVLVNLARAAGPALIGVQQNYGRSSQEADDFRAWLDLWRPVFGDRLLLAISASPITSPVITSSRGAYSRYLRNLPPSPGGGVLVWTDGAIPGWMLAVLRRWRPSTSSSGRSSAAPLLAAVVGLVAAAASRRR